MSHYGRTHGGLALIAMLFTVVLLSCAGPQEVVIDINNGGGSAFGFRNVAVVASAEAGASAAAPGAESTASIADRITSLVPLVPGEFPGPRDVNRPVGFRAPSIAVDTAGVVDVGVSEDGYLDVPGAREVGWYQFGPTPGENGSAVLAAHIAFDGQDGAFRNLPDLEVGSQVFVSYEDGTERSFDILGIVQYDKANLPIDDLFERIGQPRLVLITCGGDFNPQLRSYDDNIIAYAVPSAE